MPPEYHRQPARHGPLSQGTEDPRPDPEATPAASAPPAASDASDASAASSPNTPVFVPLLAIIALDENGVVCEWEGAAQALFGWARDEMLGSAFPPVDAEDILTWLSRAMAGHLVPEQEVTWRRHGGTDRTLRLWAAPRRDEENRLIGARAVFADITTQRRSLENAERIQAVSSALGTAVTAASVADVIVHQGIQALGASAGSVYLLTPDGKWMEALCAIGYPEDLLEEWRRFAIDASVPLSDAVRRRAPVWIPSFTDWAAAYPHLAKRHAGTPPDMAWAAIPLQLDNVVLGGIGLNFPGARTFDTEDRTFIETLAHQCAQALERARLYEAEHQARAEAEETRERQRFLAEQGERLLSSLDYNATLSNIARLLVPSLADWCVVDLLEDDGRIRRVGQVHADPSMEPLLATLHEDRPLTLDQDHPVSRVLTSGLPFFQPVIADEVVLRAAGSTDKTSTYHSLGAKSGLCVPLKVHDRVLGALSLLYGPSGRQYTEADLRFVEDLARLGAQAIENAQLHHRLIESDHAKDAFLAMLSHEMRNPLNTIAAAAKLLAAHTSEDVEAAETLTEQVRHMSRLLDDLLDVSRITSGQITLSLASLDFRDIVRKTVRSMRDDIDKRGHTVTLSLPKTPLPVRVDADRMNQVLGNILHNAVKYTPAGGLINVEAVHTADSVQLRVRDNGMGIDANLLPRIFDLFAQGARSLDRAEGGLGIGLTVVRRLVEMHGGSVLVRSAGPNSGSEFVVRLPLDNTEDSQTAPKIPEAPGAPIPGYPTALRILIVEDNKAAARMLAQVLRSWGHEVEIAHSGAAALEAGQVRVPDVVLLDIGLPDLNGYEVARRIRKDPALSRARIVVLSGYGRAEDLERSHSAGIEHHLVKPVDFDRLQEVLMSVMER